MRVRSREYSPGTKFPKKLPVPVCVRVCTHPREGERETLRYQIIFKVLRKSEIFFECRIFNS